MIITKHNYKVSASFIKKKTKIQVIKNSLFKLILEMTTLGGEDYFVVFGGDKRDRKLNKAIYIYFVLFLDCT